MLLGLLQEAVSTWSYTLTPETGGPARQLCHGADAVNKTLRKWRHKTGSNRLPCHPPIFN